MKDKLINDLIEREGGYVDHPDDKGGATKYGITESVAREYGYLGPMKDMPRDIAYKIDELRYWKPIRGDDLAWLSEKVCEEVFDTSVNCGVFSAVKFLQESLNALNNKEYYYKDVIIDGNMGNKTIAALQNYIVKRKDIDVLLKSLNCLQGAYYCKSTLHRKKNESFYFGWLRNRINL